MISIEGIECYAYNGCLEEEGIIGGKYSVDVYIEADLSKAAVSDNLEDTIDYCLIHDLVRKEMDIRSKLVEHVCGRILNSIAEKVKSFEKISVRVTKYNPPVNGKIVKASVMLSKSKAD